MKTVFTILETIGNKKRVQIDLIAETIEDKIILNDPNGFNKLEDHIILSIADKYINYSLVDSVNSSEFPKRVEVLLEYTKGI